MNSRFSIYIKDEKISEVMNSQRNKSEYVERAIRFYEDNKDALNKLANVLNKEPIIIE